MSRPTQLPQFLIGNLTLTNSKYQQQLNSLRQLNVNIRHQLELVEARIPPLNELISQLAGVELLIDTALLGDIVFDRAYTPIPNYSDGSQLLQAAILIPSGMGLVLWDREEYLAFRDYEGPRFQDIHLRFSAFEELSPALKVLLLPQVDVLVEVLLSKLPPGPGA